MMMRPGTAMVLGIVAVPLSLVLSGCGGHSVHPGEHTAKFTIELRQRDIRPVEVEKAFFLYLVGHGPVPGDPLCYEVAVQFSESAMGELPVRSGCGIWPPGPMLIPYFMSVEDYIMLVPPPNEPYGFGVITESPPSLGADEEPLPHIRFIARVWSAEPDDLGRLHRVGDILAIARSREIRVECVRCVW
jgi:hypothetical protein